MSEWECVCVCSVKKHWEQPKKVKSAVQQKLSHERVPAALWPLSHCWPPPSSREPKQNTLYWHLCVVLCCRLTETPTIYMRMSRIMTIAVWWSFHAWFNVWRKLLFKEFRTSSRTWRVGKGRRGRRQNNMLLWQVRTFSPTQSVMITSPLNHSPREHEGWVAFGDGWYNWQRRQVTETEQWRHF